eukprot:1517779-Rhodomonas_salina.3
MSGAQSWDVGCAAYRSDWWMLGEADVAFSGQKLRHRGRTDRKQHDFSASCVSSLCFRFFDSALPVFFMR